MKAVNLVSLSIGLGGICKEERKAFERQFSERKKCLGKIREHEISSLNGLIQLVAKQGGNYQDILDGFAFSFTIPNMDIEFDLLKITDSNVVNIELKSRSVPPEQVLDQLERNEHFLKPLNRPIHLFEYDASTDSVFEYRYGSLDEVQAGRLTELLAAVGNSVKCHYEDMFRASEFLVSPINEPERFLERKYLLTPHQRDIAKQAIDGVKASNQYALIIAGSAGTGKSLLLYEIARRMGAEKPSCIVHCGHLSDGHLFLNKSQTEFKVIPAKALPETNLEHYSALLFDEVHRIYPNQLEDAVELATELEKPSFFSIDKRQVLSETELRNDIDNLLSSLLPRAERVELTKKFRTNEVLAGFIKGVFGPSRPESYERNSNVKILYAKNIREAEIAVAQFVRQGYQFISMTNSKYTTSQLDALQLPGFPNTHDVIGQEFEKVVMAIGPYLTVGEDGFLQRITHPHRDYLSDKLLFQGLTRARTNLALVVYQNYPLFKMLLELVS